MRRRLIDAARAEFSDKGIEAGTTRGIAERAGCNEVTLFRHFSSKLKLLEAVVSDTSDDFAELCACGGGFSGDLTADLMKFAVVYNASLERCEGMARVMIGEGRRQPTLCKELIGDVLQPFHRAVASCLEQAKQSGKVRDGVDVMAFAEIFTSALMGGVLRRSSALTKLDRDAWLHQTVSLLQTGISFAPTSTTIKP